MTDSNDAMLNRRINEIADSLARMEGKLDQYLIDQPRRCAAHEDQIVDLGRRLEKSERDGLDRILRVESQVQDYNRQYERRFDDMLTKDFFYKAGSAMTAAAALVVTVVIWLIDVFRGR